MRNSRHSSPTRDDGAMIDDDAAEAALARVEASFHKLGSLAKRIAHAQALLVHPELRSAGWMVFRVVLHAGPVAVSEIIAETGMDKSVVSRQLKALREWGLIEVDRADDDARVVVVRLSPLGQERAVMLRTRMRDRYRLALADWTEDDISSLAVLLERLAPAIESPLRAEEGR